MSKETCPDCQGEGILDCPCYVPDPGDPNGTCNPYCKICNGTGIIECPCGCLEYPICGDIADPEF